MKNLKLGILIVSLCVVAILFAVNCGTGGEGVSIADFVGGISE